MRLRGPANGSGTELVVSLMVLTGSVSFSCFLHAAAFRTDGGLAELSGGTGVPLGRADLPSSVPLAAVSESPTNLTTFATASAKFGAHL